MQPATSDQCADRLRDQGWSYGFTRALGEDGRPRYVVDVSKGGMSCVAAGATLG